MSKKAGNLGVVAVDPDEIEAFVRPCEEAIGAGADEGDEGIEAEPLQHRARRGRSASAGPGAVGRVDVDDVDADKPAAARMAKRGGDMEGRGAHMGADLQHRPRGQGGHEVEQSAAIGVRRQLLHGAVALCLKGLREGLVRLRQSRIGEGGGEVVPPRFGKGEGAMGEKAPFAGREGAVGGERDQVPPLHEGLAENLAEAIRNSPRASSSPSSRIRRCR